MTILEEIAGTKIKLFNGKSFDLVEIFSISEEQLSDAYMQQASVFAFFSTLQAEAERQLAVAKFDAEQEYAVADEYHRHELEHKEKKFTEAVIRSLVIRDNDYIVKEEKRIRLEYEVAVLKAVTRALAQRGDMLISLGALTRQEMSMTGMSMRENSLDNLPKELKTIVNAAVKYRR